MAEKGTLKLDVTAKIKAFYLYVYNSDGNLITADSKTINSGSGILAMGSNHYRCAWNSAAEQFKGTFEFEPAKLYGDVSFTIAASYPDKTKEALKVTGFSVTLGKGGTLQMSAIVAPSGSGVTWKSTSIKTATVSSKG